MAIIFRTTDNLKWGAGKGGNLTPTEVDLNFWDLLTRIGELESEPPEGVGIANITLTGGGTTLTIALTDSTTRGPFLLPTARFVLLGEWAPDTSYPAQGFITHDDQTYLINIAHTSADTFDPGANDGHGHNFYGLLPFPTNKRDDVGFFYPGTPGFGLPFDGTGTMFARVFSLALYLPAGLPGSVATLATAASADLQFPIMKNTSVIGSILFAAGETDGTFAFAVNVQFNGTSDRLRVLPFPIVSEPPSEAPLDATAFDLAVNFVVTKGLP